MLKKVSRLEPVCLNIKRDDQQGQGNQYVQINPTYQDGRLITQAEAGELRERNSKEN